MSEPAPVTARAERRERFSTQVLPSIATRARATVRGVQLATGGADYSLAQLVEDAITAYCEHLESTYNDGRPWTTRDRLPPGRHT